MAISCLPTYPLVLFGIIEPILLTWGYITGIQNPSKFYADQVPNAPITTTITTTTTIPPQALTLTLALINVYLLLAALAIVCCFTAHAPVARGFLLAVAIADYGHVYATYAGAGPAVFWDPLGSWNGMVWGSVGVSLFLNVHRWLTLLGVFGRLGGGGGGNGESGSAGGSGSDSAGLGKGMEVKKQA